MSRIEREFGVDGLYKYLLECFETDSPGVGRDRTDITAALRLAHTVYEEAVAGSLSKFQAADDVKIMKHSDIVAFDGSQPSVPNVRILI